VIDSTDYSGKVSVVLPGVSASVAVGYKGDTSYGLKYTVPDNKTMEFCWRPGTDGIDDEISVYAR